MWKGQKRPRKPALDPEFDDAGDEVGFGLRNAQEMMRNLRTVPVIVSVWLATACAFESFVDFTKIALGLFRILPGV